MPIHPWTRVSAECWHAFYVSWLSALQEALNNDLLPSEYYALAEMTTTETTENSAPEKHRTIVVRRSSGDDMVALIEIVSPGNKAARHALNAFVTKAVEALSRGYHLLVIDLFPPGPRDPNGIHGAIWSEISEEPFTLPADEPLTLAAYASGQRKVGTIEPTAVGRTLLDMPLFLTEDTYVEVPLEATYQVAYRGVPRRWQTVLEGEEE